MSEIKEYEFISSTLSSSERFYFKLFYIFTILEHISHICHLSRIKLAQVKAGERLTIIEHALHIGHARGIEVRKTCESGQIFHIEEPLIA